MTAQESPLRHEDYTIACICPMGVEQAPVEAMLDETHCSLPIRHGMGSYTLGRMSKHKLVIAILSTTGTIGATAGAVQLLNDFPSTRLIIVVGIAGGIPDLARGIDLRLGDVVVSRPTGLCPGVVQFDRGKALSNGRLERAGTLHRPPDILLAAAAKLEARHQREGSEIPQHITAMHRKYPKMHQGNYIHQGAANDTLFLADFHHRSRTDCRDCDPGQAVQRVPRADDTPVVHYGTIGSSNVVVKDGRTRDQLRDELDIQCVEMEAAGVMHVFPCLVVRGICDYADSHKNKRWQPYAAAVAAGYMKELLSMIPLDTWVENEGVDSSEGRGAMVADAGETDSARDVVGLRQWVMVCLIVTLIVYTFSGFR
ncbi:5'-methylthioadenosine/S-adenosylhomocysteine nucleosidase family protein [Aspergillus saccharolyticus JOP 1030-1]|uniref:Pfs domain-containing protein n=1 Tax=Aspergillus saccharolyticus JOP 1030-1 TaxID=1450539 RepID=A0A318ZJG1_9EURO|nr:pfs domain-containing protein [Aspergillus saccharolyticus JOP 1030-1]PYH44693.1 pfs domain-containing protein [Aspergillus saccharolyticus JOP 1030-1]